MKRLTIAAAALTLVLAGCSSDSSGSTDAANIPESDQAFLAEHDLDGMASDEIVEHLDGLGGAERPTDLMASVRVEELVMTDGEEEIGLELPEDRFYLSVAPYVNQTHECFYHSLTTCQGELSGEEVDVKITDEAGEVLVEETTTTAANGFVGYWLPRDVEGTVEVSYDGKTGEVPFATDEEGATCLTTLQVA
ncbi:CueP family metal-binding protein [Georgenia sp. 10Sc9-8]|uniref:CueP family metal-binding protein n=1 Tax=Georgenia halotolerans TaxID=3028317 RepID=A0ABT5TZZ5_9MICO|nr:CueP family metal-binding protein [Georgenia halotolerans]